MVTGKRILSITLFFIFMAIFIGALKPEGREECMVLSRAQAAGIRGGSSSSVSTVPPSVDITLSNVPYHYQDISGHSRSAYYCGLASALMTRLKGKVGSSPFSYPRYDIEKWMKDADDDLKNGNYSYAYKVNLVPNGLLYVKTNGSRSEQFEGTKTVVYDLFYNKYGFLPYPYYTNGLSIYVDNYYEAVDRIWNHIKNNNQPVVVITDLKKLNYYNERTPYPAWNDARPLHYQVVYGIFERDGEKYFRVHDPLLKYINYKEFSRSQYEDILAMSEYVPAWVYNYGVLDMGKYRPSYIMLVSGI